jgi:hypothetical protein
LKLSLEWSMDDHMRDFKKSLIYQFQLFITEIIFSNYSNKNYGSNKSHMINGLNDNDYNYY